MEGNVKGYLVLIANTISIIIFWMLINIFIGIYLNYAFFEGSPTWKNFVYYAFALLTFVFFATLYYQKMESFCQAGEGVVKEVSIDNLVLKSINSVHFYFEPIEFLRNFLLNFSLNLF